MNRGRGSNRGGGGDGRHHASRGRSPRSADHHVARSVNVMFPSFFQFVVIAFAGFLYCVWLLLLQLNAVTNSHLKSSSEAVIY